MNGATLCTGIAAAVLAVTTAIGCDGTKPEQARASQSCTEPKTASASAAPGTGVGARVFVVERASSSLAVYDLERGRLLDARISGLGNLRHATMTFSPSLRWGYLATRSGKLTRIDLENLSRAGVVNTSDNSIDIAIAQDGEHIAVAEYEPGGLTVLDAESLDIVSRVSAKDSRATAVVDVRGDRFACVLMEGREAWIVAPNDGKDDGYAVQHRIPLEADAPPYDAMITPDGRHYVVGHLHSDVVSVVDIRHPARGARTVSIRPSKEGGQRDAPVKLPHMASWATANDHTFVPLVGRDQLAVLDADTFELVDTISLRGHPVYAVASPLEHEVWVSFSGKGDDAYVQIVDSEAREVVDTLEVGGRIYHMDFTPRGGTVLVSANRDDELVRIDARTREIVDRETVRSPSGIFGPWRAFMVGL